MDFFLKSCAYIHDVSPLNRRTELYSDIWKKFGEAAYQRSHHEESDRLDGRGQSRRLKVPCSVFPKKKEKKRKEKKIRRRSVEGWMVEKSSSPRSNEGFKEKGRASKRAGKKKSIARNREGLINKCTKPCQVGRNHFVAYTHPFPPLSVFLALSPFALIAADQIWRFPSSSLWVFPPSRWTFLFTREWGWKEGWWR